MVIKILPSKSFANTLRYHQNKAGKGVSEQIELHSILNEKFILSTLEEFAAQNPKCSNPVFHVTIAFPPEEHPSNEILCKIADDYMENMGYKEQPYVVYKHSDKDHDHLHILSTRVDINGKIIKDFQENKRSMRIREDLEKKYGLIQVDAKYKSKKQGHNNMLNVGSNDYSNAKQHIENAILDVLCDAQQIDYDCFAKKLKDFGVGISSNENDGLMFYLVDNNYKRTSPAINASNLDPKWNLNNLEQFINYEKKESINFKVRFKWIKQYSAITKAKFEGFLKRNNLEINYLTNSSGIYGIRFLDVKNNVVKKGSEIGCSWNYLKKILNDTVDVKNGEEIAYIESLYKKIYRNSNAYNESSFLLQNVISQLLIKEIEKSNNNEVIAKLKPFISDFCKIKVDSIPRIEQKEQELYTQQIKLANKYMSQTSDIGACLIAYSFGYEIANDILFNAKQSVATSCNLHGFNIPYQKLYSLPKEVKKAVRNTIMAIEKQQKSLIPECLAFSPKENYASAVINNIIKDAEKLKQTAEENYINNNYGRLSESCETKEELIGQLLYRGIKIEKENNEQVNLKFRGIEIIVDDEELAKTISKYNMNDLNQKATTDSKKLSEINQNDQSDDKNTKWQTKPQTDNFAKWIEDNYKQVNNENTSSNNYENDYKKEFNYPEPHENYYTHYSFPITTIQFGPIISTSFNVTRDKPIFKDELTEEEEEELNRKLKNKKGRKI